MWSAEREKARRLLYYNVSVVFCVISLILLTLLTLWLIIKIHLHLSFIGVVLVT